MDRDSNLLIRLGNEAGGAGCMGDFMFFFVKMKIIIFEYNDHN